MVPDVALLAFAVAVNLGYYVLPGSQSAWAYVLFGIESTALWVYFLTSKKRGPYTVAVAAWATFEAWLRPACRLQFPMQAKPETGGRDLCDAAMGVTAFHQIGVLAALLLAAYLHGKLWR